MCTKSVKIAKFLVDVVYWTPPTLASLLSVLSYSKIWQHQVEFLGLFPQCLFIGTSWFGFLGFLWSAKGFIESNPLVHAVAGACATVSGNRNYDVCYRADFPPRPHFFSPSWIQSKLPRSRTGKVEYCNAFICFHYAVTLKWSFSSVFWAGLLVQLSS